MRKYSIPEYNQVTTPSNPATGFNKLYFKSDDHLYRLDSSGNEVDLTDVGGNITLETSSVGTDSYSISGYTTLVDKLLIPFISDVANTGAATLDFGGAGAKAIVNMSGNVLNDNDIDANRLVFLKYDLANDRFVLLVSNEKPESPIVSTNFTYTISNGLVDRDFDANATSVDELMDVLDTLTNDLEGANVFGTGTPSSIVQTYITNNATGVRTFDANSTTLNELADVIATIITDLSNGNMFNGGTLQETNQTYTVTNGVTDRTADANATTVNELADLVSTIISDLKNTNFIL